MALTCSFVLLLHALQIHTVWLGLTNLTWSDIICRYEYFYIPIIPCPSKSQGDCLLSQKMLLGANWSLRNITRTFTYIHVLFFTIVYKKPIQRHNGMPLKVMWTNTGTAKHKIGSGRQQHMAELQDNTRRGGGYWSISFTKKPERDTLPWISSKIKRLIIIQPSPTSLTQWPRFLVVRSWSIINKCVTQGLCCWVFGQYLMATFIGSKCKNRLKKTPTVC